jgi:hypothetical protein
MWYIDTTTEKWPRLQDVHKCTGDSGNLQVTGYNKFAADYFGSLQVTVYRRSVYITVKARQTITDTSYSKFYLCYEAIPC